MISQVESQRGYFIGVRKDQLGARLLVITNCIRLADDFGTDYRINWFPKGHSAPTLSKPLELFDESYLERHFLDSATFEEIEGNAKPIRAFLNDKTPERLEAHLEAGQHVLLDEGFDIIVFAWEEDEQVLDRCSGYIHRLGLQPTIRKKMDLIDAAMGNAEHSLIAYHIRRGDILDRSPWKDGMWPSKIEPDELYSLHLETIRGQAAMVFSDQAECINRLKQRHPDVQSISDIVALDDCTPCQRDFLELYAMSRADHIIAPVISAFSSAAARLSGHRRLSFVDVLKPPQIDEAYDRVRKRFADPAANFVNLSEAAHIYSKLARHLATNDQEKKAYGISRALLDGGADNAFLPLLHAINCIYLQDWNEGLVSVDRALAAPGLWNEDYATALALRAYILAALGDADMARNTWVRALWLKPYLPDISVVGSAMLERAWLQPNTDLHFDTDLLRDNHLPYIKRHFLTVEKKMLHGGLMDFSLLAIEWPYFVLDRKWLRGLEDRRFLILVRNTVGRDNGGPRDQPMRDSFRGLLQSYLGNFKIAKKLTRAATGGEPDNFLLRKRRAEVLWAAGERQEAYEELGQLHLMYPDNAFGLFLLGHFLMKDGKPKRALNYYELAAEHDDATAAIHAQLAECYRAVGRDGDAADAYDVASGLAPTFQKFANQRDRLKRSSGRVSDKNKVNRN